MKKSWLAMKEFFSEDHSSRLRMLERLFLRRWGFKKYGKKTYIYKPLLISGRKNISLGNNVTFFYGARIESITNHEGVPYEPSIIIGDNTSFEQGAHITSAGKLTIGHDCSFGARVTITNVKHSYEKIDVKNSLQKYVVKDVVIGDFCCFGMDSKVFPGSHIGNNAIIGANSIVIGDLPSYCVAVGCPARVIKIYDFSLKRWINNPKK